MHVEDPILTVIMIHALSSVTNLFLSNWFIASNVDYLVTYL